MTLVRQQFLIFNTKTQLVKELSFIKIKKFFFPKDIFKRIKRQSTDWEKIFVKHISNNTLISSIYKELLKIDNKKEPLNLKKWGKIFIPTSPNIYGWQICI